MLKNDKFKYGDMFYKQLLDKTNEMYSVVDISEYVSLTPEMLFKNNTKYRPYFLDGKMLGLSQLYSDIIFCFDDDIYIYLSNTDPIISSFYCKIYYPIRKKQDVDFFIINLKKIK